MNWICGFIAGLLFIPTGVLLYASTRWLCRQAKMKTGELQLYFFLLYYFKRSKAVEEVKELFRKSY